MTGHDFSVAIKGNNKTLLKEREREREREISPGLKYSNKYTPYNNVEHPKIKYNPYLSRDIRHLIAQKLEL